MRSKIIDQRSKIVQDRVQLKPKTVRGFLLESQRVLPRELKVDSTVPKGELILKETNAHIIINEHRVVFLEEYGVIIVCELGDF